MSCEITQDEEGIQHQSISCKYCVQQAICKSILNDSLGQGEIHLSVNMMTHFHSAL